MSGRSVAVIGAGPAGLAAAWRLASRGVAVTVYEAAARVGGRLRTEELDGVAADVAVQLISDGFDRTIELIGALGLADRLEPAPGRDALWRGGRAHPLRYGSIPGMLATSALPAGLKLRLGTRYLPFLERHADVLDLNEPSRAAAAGLDGESIAEWGRREMGDAFVELMAYPLLASYYGIAPEETSAGFFHCLSRAGLRVRVLGVRGGLGALSTAMAAALLARGVVVETDRAVESVEPAGSGEGGEGGEGGGVVVRTGRGASRHGAAVIAVPAGEAARLLPGVAWLREVWARPTASLVLVTDGPTPTGWFGLSIPRTELPGSTIAAVCVQEEKRTELTGPERGSLVLVPAPEAAERWSEGEPRQALESALPWLDRVLPGVRERVVEARLVRLEGAAVPRPGDLARLRAFDPSAPAGPSDASDPSSASRLPRTISLAGDYLVSPTVEGAVRSGLMAADRAEQAIRDGS